MTGIEGDMAATIVYAAIFLVGALCIGTLFLVRDVYKRLHEQQYAIFCAEHENRRMAEDLAKLHIEMEDCVKEYYTHEKDSPCEKP